MNDSKTVNTAHNLFYSILFQIVGIVYGLVVPQFMLSTYGPSIFGLTASVTQALGYLAIVEAGLGDASIQALYFPLAQRDFLQISAVVSAAREFYHKTGIYFVILLIMLALIYPMIIGSQLPAVLVFLTVLVMGLANVLEFFFIGKYRVLITADQKVSIVHKIKTFSLIIITAAQVILITLKINIIIVLAVPTGINFLGGFFIKKSVLMRYPGIDLYYPPAKDSLSKRWSILVHQITALVVYNTPTILLTIFTDLRIVSIYAIYNIVYSSLFRMLNLTFHNSSLASFGRLFSENDLARVRKNFAIYESAYFIILTCVYTIAIIMIIPFVRLYTKGVCGISYVDYKIAVMFTIIGVLNNLRVPANTMINAAGHFKETQWRSIAEAAINFTVSIISVNIFGIYGVLIGGIVSFCYRTFDIILYTNKRILFQSNLMTFKRCGINIAVGIILSLTVSNMFFLTVSSWWEFLLDCCLAGMGVMFVVVITNYLMEPQVFKNMIGKLPRG